MAERKPLVLIGGEQKEMDSASDEIAGVVNSGGSGVKRVAVVTQLAYDALDPPDPNTLYFIEEA